MIKKSIFITILIWLTYLSLIFFSILSIHLQLITYATQSSLLGDGGFLIGLNESMSFIDNSYREFTGIWSLTTDSCQLKNSVSILTVQFYSNVNCNLSQSDALKWLSYDNHLDIIPQLEFLTIILLILYLPFSIFHYFMTSTDINRRPKIFITIITSMFWISICVLDILIYLLYLYNINKALIDRPPNYLWNWMFVVDICALELLFTLLISGITLLLYPITH